MNKGNTVLIQHQRLDGGRRRRGSTFEKIGLPCARVRGTGEYVGESSRPGGIQERVHYDPKDPNTRRRIESQGTPSAYLRE